MLGDPPITDYIEIYEGVRKQRFAVAMKLTEDGRKKLQGSFTEENYSERAAFVLNGKIFAVPVIKVGVLSAEEGFSLPGKNKKDCQRLVRILRRAPLRQGEAQQGEDANAGHAPE